MNLNNTEIEDNESPYCTECGACGQEGCCSPVLCKFTDKCDYGASYMIGLKCSYQSWEKFYNIVYPELPQEFKDKVDAIWEEMFDRWYLKKQKVERINEIMNRIDKGGV